jgi:succinate-semialdehyde dehydrogenase / glutarate-semialdehyde dehydrogenase
MIATINPTTGEKEREYTPLNDGELAERLEAAWSAYERHRRTSLEDRAARLHRVAEVLEQDCASLARLMAIEMGKPVRQGRAEVEKCARVCRYYADGAERMLSPEQVATDAADSHVRYDPLGPVLAVMPWNFPLWQVFRFAAPAIMAGNVVLLKHAANVPGCALALEAMFARAGFAPGVFQTLLVGTKAVGTILDDPRVRAATLTGSTRAGSAVGELAGRNLKKAVLELGGSDPFVVMPSADIARAASVAVTARTINNGQSCIAAKRFIVHEAVYDQFMARFVEEMQRLVIGDPLEENTDIGPLATRAGRDSVAEQVARSVEAGANVVLGGEPRPGTGFFYPPTVLVEIPESAPAYEEEIFGPVAAVFRVRDLDEAIRIANASRFGLGSSLWSRAADEVERFIEEIEAGQAFVNAMVASDPRLPFGGVKESGIGRELGVWGIREFVNVKTVSITWPGDAETLVSRGKLTE